MGFLDPQAFLFSTSLVGLSLLCLIVISRPGLIEDRPALGWWIAGDLLLSLHRIILLMQPGILVSADYHLLGMQKVDFRTADSAFLLVGMACGVVSICRLRNIVLGRTKTLALVAGPALLACVAVQLFSKNHVAELVVLTMSAAIPVLQIWAVGRGVSKSLGFTMLTVANVIIVLVLMFALFAVSMAALTEPAATTAAAAAALTFTPPFFGILADFIASIVRTFSISLVLNERQRSLITMLSTMDTLTGVLNRRGAQPLLQQAFNHASRYRHPFSIAIIDIDHFKRVNDTLGHEAGDAVLKAFAECLRKGKRDCDVLARWGGEEFILAFPATTAEGARVALERMRIEIPGLMALSAPCSVTFSAGVAELRTDDRQREISGLLEIADACLYRAKVTRDCIVVQTPEAASPSLSGHAGRAGRTRSAA